MNTGTGDLPRLPKIKYKIHLASKFNHSTPLQMTLGIESSQQGAVSEASLVCRTEGEDHQYSTLTHINDLTKYDVDHTVLSLDVYWKVFLLSLCFIEPSMYPVMSFCLLCSSE